MIILMINIKSMLLLAVVTILAVSCARIFTRGGGNKKELPMPQFTTVSVEEFEALIDESAIQLLDVRTQEEYEEGRIAWAVLVDVNEDDFVEKAKAVLDPARPVGVYCRSGRRSARAARLLAAQGFKVTNLDGGVLAWQDAGKQLIK